MIGVIGLSFKSAPVEIRERFALTDAQVNLFMEKLKIDKKTGSFVLLSTCNRTEVYFHMPKSCKKSCYNSVLKDFLAIWNTGKKDKKHFYTYWDDLAVKHLFKVSSGMESMILGEDQIINQVKQAYKLSAAHGFTSTVINKLFHKAFEVGKRIRTETEINHGPTSIGAAAVDLAASLTNFTMNHNVLLIGAGETGELVLKHFLNRGIKNIFITNRTLSKAENLAQKYEGIVVPFEEYRMDLKRYDIIITSTSSKEPVIVKNDIVNAMQAREQRPMFLIDISVPRNIHEDVKDIMAVHLFNIDYLEKIVKDNAKNRENEVAKANVILKEIHDDFFEWYKSLNLTDIIEKISNKFVKLNQTELNKQKNRLPETEFSKIEEYGNFLSRKFTNLIVKNLKNITHDGNREEIMNYMLKLFELNEKEQDNNRNERKQVGSLAGE